MIGYGTFRSLVEFVREPDVQIGMIGGVVSMGQILCLPMVLFGFMLVYFSSQGSLTKAEKNAQ